MIDRFGKEIDFSEFFMEETLSAKDRKELDDSMYGIVYTDENGKKVRKYPLNDEKHVLQAVRFFNKAEEKYKPELAHKIVKRAEELDMDYSGWDVLKPYLGKGKNVQEGYVQEGVGLILGAVAVTGVVGALLIALSKKVFNKSITTAKANAAKARININYSQANIKKIIPERAHAYVVNYVNLNNKAWIAFNNSLDSEIDVLTNALNEIAQAPDNSCISKVKALLKTKTGIVQNSTGGPYGAMTNPNQWERFTFINNGKLSTDELLNSEKVIDAIKNEHIKDVDELKKIQDETNQRLLALKKKKEEVEKILEQQPNKKLEKKCVAEIRKRCDFVFKHMMRKSQSIDWAIRKLTNPTYFFQFYDENGNEIGDGPSVGVVEQYMTFEWLDKHFPNSDDSTTGTSDFDERDDDPDDCFTESFEEMFGPVIQEAFDAVTGEEIPIDKVYSLEEMKERTYTEEELKKSKREIKDYLKFANDIVKRISNQVEKDAKPPTGNQNCLLCTWCAEIGFRGVNKNPRPVYSPCDPIFKVHGENIVRDPMKIIPRGYDNLLEHLADVSQPFARFYVHVNWKGSRGGHEFLLLKVIDDECYIVDAQAGKVDKLSDTHKYFTDINWENSYLCRLDNKNFNRKLFDTMNDPKMTLPWDPKRDIPYMLREGLITKDEAETELKRVETNEFYKVLKEKLGQTPIQESALDPTTIIPKDLRDWLKNGDYSSLEKDDSYYYVEGHPVEEFWSDPEFVRSAFYLDDKNDPSYNSIVFSDENGNGLIYDPTDGWYYYLYHDWTDDDTGFLHRERLSSKSWTQIIDPVHSKSIKDLDEKRSEISKELTRLKANPVYGDIEYGATNSHFGKGFFKSDCSAMEKRWNAIGHEWCNAVEKFANKYKFSELSETIDIFANKTMSLFVPTIGSHVYDIEAYKEGAKNVIKAFQDVEKSLKESTIQESAIGEILNGVNPFSNKRVFHISQDGHLDGQVFKPRVPEYLDKYDPSQDKFEDVENPRVCFSPSIEGCLNAIMVTIGRWKTAEKLREWYVYVPEKPLKEYKHRTNKQLIKEKKVYDANVTDEIWIEEPVRLKQYGIIRIDQVSSKSIKDTVPTTKGFAGHRYKYSFKWHWLVKPKVIADLPYDYSPNEVCKDMIADMEKYKYGLAENGTVHSASAHDYDTKYKLQSPEEFEQNGGGICYDYVEFMEGYLNAYGYDCKKYFISTNTADNDTHTFLLVRDGKGWKDGFIYPESSFKLMEGVYEVKNYEEAALKIMDKIFDVNHNGEKYDEIKYYVWEYSGHPPYGSDMKTCMEYFSKGDPIHEGTAMKIKRKD